MHQDHQHGGGHEATGGGHVGVGDHFVTPHYMVQIYQIAARQGHQPLEQVHPRWAPLTPQAYTAYSADYCQGQGSKNQYRQERFEHGAHLIFGAIGFGGGAALAPRIIVGFRLSQKSLQIRRAS